MRRATLISKDQNITVTLASNKQLGNHQEQLRNTTLLQVQCIHVGFIKLNKTFMIILNLMIVKCCVA